MGYDSRAVKVAKIDKIMAIMTFNKDRERHYIKQTVKCLEKNAKTKSARNRGSKDEQ